MTLLQQPVERFNEGVRTGDFGPMVATFSPDAPAGRMSLTVRDEQIVRLVVEYGR